MKIHLPKKLFELTRDGCTQSMLTSFAECRRKTELAYMQGYTSEFTSNALAFGSLFHGCLEYLYARTDFFLLEKNIARYLDAAIAYVCRQHRVTTAQSRVWVMEDERSLLLNEGYLRLLIPLYFKRYWKSDREKKWIKNEEVFKNVWQGRITFTGKYDRVCTNQRGDTWVYETKTKSRIDPSLQDRLSFDFQANFYILNLLLSTGKLAKGFVYDIIKRPEQRMGAQETLPEFIARVKTRITPDYFQRLVVTRDESEFQQWVERDLTPLVDEFLAWMNGRLPTYRNFASCETRYGACKFLKICGLNNYTGLYKRKILFPELAE